MIPATAGERIRLARISCGYKSAAALAKALKISRATVSAWECGKSTPHGVRLKKLTDLVQKPADWILYGSTDVVEKRRTLRDRMMELFDASDEQTQMLGIQLYEKLLKH